MNNSTTNQNNVFRHYSFPAFTIDGTHVPGTNGIDIVLNQEGCLHLIANNPRIALTADEYPGPVTLAGSNPSNSTSFVADQCYVGLNIFTPIKCTIQHHQGSAEIVTRAKFYYKSLRIVGPSYPFLLSNFDCTLIPSGGQYLPNSMCGCLEARMTSSGRYSILDIRNAMYYMLTCAQRAPIRCLCYETYAEENLLETYLFPCEGAHRVQHPLLSLDSGAIAHFLSSCHVAFLDNLNIYALYALIEYYWHSFESEYREISFIFGSVFMEAFKFHFAYNNPAYVKLIFYSLKK